MAAMKKQTMLLAVTLIGFGLVAVPGHADYVLELKNGRSLTVASYREEGGMIKFSGFGGEIAIAKDQIQTIRQSSAIATNSFNIPQATKTASATPGRPPARPEGAKDTASGEAAARAKEEREYQDKVRSLTEQLKSARDQYSQAVRGTTSPEPSILQSNDQIRARNEDVTSRFKEAQRNPSPPAPVKLYRPSPFSSLPPEEENRVAGQTNPDLGRPQPLTESERSLADMRSRTIQLEQEREKLINEMRQKGFNTGSLFTE